MKTLIISLSLLTHLFLPSFQMVLIGLEVMDQDDLQLLKFYDAVGNGNLDYGDRCRNPSIPDITHDVCFHSNPSFQCLDGMCKCSIVRIPGEIPEKFEEMVYQNGSCKKLENWKCETDQECSYGLSCLAPASSNQEDIGLQFNQNELPSDRLGREFEEDEKSEMIKNANANFRRRILKEKLRKLFLKEIKNKPKSRVISEIEENLDLIDSSDLESTTVSTLSSTEQFSNLETSTNSISTGLELGPDLVDSSDERNPIKVCTRSNSSLIRINPFLLMIIIILVFPSSFFL